MPKQLAPDLKVDILRAVGALRQALALDHVPPDCSEDLLILDEALERFEGYIFDPARRTAPDWSYAREREVFFDGHDLT
jgi:hypothetical protein